MIGFQQFEQMMADRLANVALAEVLGQQPEDARQHPALGSAHIHAGHPSGEPRSGEPGSRAALAAYSILMPASSMTLRQRSTSLR